MPVALITGCSSGIGRALADAFKQAGYEVWATARKASAFIAPRTYTFASTVGRTSRSNMRNMPKS